MNDPTHAVLSSLKSLTLTNPSLRFDEANKIVYRHPSSLSSTGNVSLICGGGSGHEPGFSAFVGQGLLTACVCGTIFASPSAEQVRTCLLHRLPPDSQGTLVILANYTGDVLNFGMAVEKARAMGKKIAMVVVGDDVGVGRSKSGKVGRRGLSGQAFVVKICGALAEAGTDLDETERVGQLVADNLISLGASLGRVHVPGKALAEAEEEEKRLGPGMVEIGMGVHNEPGCEQTKTDLPGLVKRMLAQMLDTRDPDRGYLHVKQPDQTLLLINNYGGVSNLELGAIVTEVTFQLEKDYVVKPRRVIAGPIYGSLNGQGFGLSLLKLVETGLGPGKSMLDLFDAPAQATGWSANIRSDTWENIYVDTQEAEVAEERQVKPSNLKSRLISNLYSTKLKGNS